MSAADVLMDVQRFGVKVFAGQPASIPLRDFVPVFHGWIQKQIIGDHLLIDVHDYSHIHQGPGILLVGHEGNFSIDGAEGRTGLIYYRKQPIAGAIEQRLATMLQTVLTGCRLLEEDPALAGRIHFRKDEFLLIANDRLLAMNQEQTFLGIQSVFARALEQVLGPAHFRLTSVATDSRERLAIRATTGKP
jgi:hypothetical protein